jgi:hypothetical protein
LLGAGFVRSLSRPGENVTGISLLAELDGKRQELLMEAIPTARRRVRAVSMWRSFAQQQRWRLSRL